MHSANKHPALCFHQCGAVQWTALQKYESILEKYFFLADFLKMLKPHFSEKDLNTSVLFLLGSLLSPRVGGREGEGGGWWNVVS